MFCKNGVTIALFSTKNIPAPSFLWGSGAPYALTARRAARAVATRHREPRHAPTPPQPNPSCTVHPTNLLFGRRRGPRSRRASTKHVTQPSGESANPSFPRVRGAKRAGGPRTDPAQGAWARNGAGGMGIGILGPSVTGVSPFPPIFQPQIYLNSILASAISCGSRPAPGNLRVREPSRQRFFFRRLQPAKGTSAQLGICLLAGFGFCVGLPSWRWSTASWR